MHLYHVDAFTSQVFGGNPAAVCLLTEPRDDGWMQALAAELNLPTTAFVLRQGAEGDLHLRWFGVRGEMNLCGHGTLAAAHILWERGEAPPSGPLHFFTRGGALVARRSATGWIELDFPATPAAPMSAEKQQAVAQALNERPLWVGSNRLHVLAELASESAVRSLSPDLGQLAAAVAPRRGAIVTARGSGGYDIVSRYFAPAMGIDEDQVTGSAHCALGPYWAPQLAKTELLAFQASPRGGTLRVRVDQDRVFLAGQAATLWRGEVVDGMDASWRLHSARSPSWPGLR
jgi:PhzF family phenazine biosynthesis protein